MAEPLIVEEAVVDAPTEDVIQINIELPRSEAQAAVDMLREGGLDTVADALQGALAPAEEPVMTGLEGMGDELDGMRRA